MQVVAAQRRTARNGVVAAVALVLAAAYGGTAARAAELVRIASSSLSVAHAPLVLGMADPSIFAAEGIAIKVSDLRGATANCIAALLSGSVDLCQVGTPTGLDAIAEGAKLKTVAVLAGPVNEILLSSKAAAASGVAPDAPIADRIRALRGLNLATAAPGTAHYLLLEATLAKAGLSMKDVRYRPLGDVTAVVQSIRNGQIDGSLWTIGALSPLLMDGSGVRWISMARGDIQEFRSLPNVAVFGRAEWVERNADLVRRVHAGYAAATRRIKADMAGTSKLVKAVIAPDLAQNLWDDGFAQARAALLDGAKVSAESWAQMLELQARSGGKQYGPAAFDKVVISAAQAD